jgi:hypothetical protein
MERWISVSGRRGALWVAVLVAVVTASRLQATSNTAFDGYYKGTGTSADRNVALAFTVIQGGVYWQTPGPSTGLVGQVTPAGGFSATVVDADHPTNGSTTLTGTLTVHGNSITGTGTFSSASPPCGTVCSGTFSVAQVTGPCTPIFSSLCVSHPGDHEFEITIHYFTAQGGGAEADAHAIDLTCAGITQGGNFAFFQDSNPEVIVKVLNACAINNVYWVFISAATNVGFTVVVRDTVTGAVVTYSNPDLHAAIPVQDTAALPCS